MTESPLAAAQRLFAQAVEALRGVAEAGSAGERVSVLTLCEATVRQLDQVTVATVAGLDRDGVFAERGYRSAVQALSDCWLGAVRGPPPDERGHRWRHRSGWTAAACRRGWRRPRRCSRQAGRGCGTSR